MPNNNPSIFTVSLEDFQQQVIQASHTKPVMVDFWADWCGPCLVLSPILDRLMQDYADQVSLAKLEVDEDDNMKLAGQYQVRGFPTIILFHLGKEIARFSSAKPQVWIENFLDQHLPS